MLDVECLASLQSLSHLLGEVAAARSAEGKFAVFTGCGTSGRLAYAISNMMNEEWLRLWGERESAPLPFGYLIAGGDDALIAAKENAEVRFAYRFLYPSVPLVVSSLSSNRCMAGLCGSWATGFGEVGL